MKFPDLEAVLRYRVLRLAPTARPFVFGIGLSRTGTTSLNSALKILGYNAFHLPPIVRRRKGELVLDWPWWMSKYDAATDISVSSVFKALHRRFPQSKFVLTTREKAEWLDSCERLFTPWLVENRIRQRQFWILEMRQALYGSVVFERGRYAEAYDRFHDDVRRHFRDRPDALLDYDVIGGEGWDKLCGFTGRKVPQTSFPWKNRLAGVSADPAET